jgi:hypothetical protein
VVRYRHPPDDHTTKTDKHRGAKGRVAASSRQEAARRACGRSYEDVYSHIGASQPLHETRPSRGARPVRANCDAVDT